MSQTASTPQATPRRDPRPRLRTVLVCDLVDSTGLFRTLGDARAAGLLRSHDRLARQLMGAHAGREIDKSDGFLVLFERPAGAVRFALEYQQVVAALGQKEGVDLRARVGIHFGEVLIWRNDNEATAAGATTVSVEGLAKPVAARLASLARPGQILLSDVARNLSQRADAAAPEPDEELPPAQLAWADHGAYELQGVGDPIRVHEVARSRSELRGAPLSGGKSRRARPPFWRRPLLVSATAALVVACVATLSLMLFSPPDAIAFGERDWVVIGSLDNQTGDPRYNGALETALRTSLEQSRFVNVLPEMRVRDVLGRMTREPDSPLSRQVGSEVALREGARALVLPTIAEVGGRVRLGAEVIDPATGATVFSEYQDGAGPEDSLRAMSTVAARLRGRLGEAVQEIESSSMPVADAASPSLDALRAYSLGLKANGEVRLEDALLHYEQALALDPDFAMAMVSVGRMRLAMGDRVGALEWFSRAEALPGRLSERERLALDALTAMVRRQPDYPRRWRAFLELYPDHHPAANNLALFSWWNNRYEEMLAYAEQASSPRSITRPASVYTQGMALVALGRFDEAHEAFESATSLGYSHGVKIVAAGGLAAQRRFEEARAMLNAEAPRSPRDRLSLRGMELAIAIDEGRWSELPRLADALVAASVPEAGVVRWSGLAAQLAVDRDPDADSGRRLRAGQMFDLATSELGTEFHPDGDGIVLAMLYAGYVAARSGDMELARRVISSARVEVEASPLPILMQMLVILEARADLADGEALAAARRLTPLFDGTELVLAHAVMGEAQAALGNNEVALEHMRWLAGHRGRAYAELSVGYMLRPENVIQINRAQLRAAELALALERREEAAGWLAAFNSAWPDLEVIPDLKAIVERVELGLNEG